MKAIKFLRDKLVYLLLNTVMLFIGWFLVYKGISEPTDNQCLSTSDSSFTAIYIAIGTSLIATAIVTYLDLLRHLSIAELLGKVNNLINEGGLQWIFKKRDLDKYDSLMESLKTDMDVCGYSLGAFFDSYSDLIKDKAKRNVRFRILLVNPSSEFSKSRALNEGRGPDAFQDRISTLVQFFKGINGVEVKFFNAPLSTMIFRIGDVMFVGPHFYRKQSKATLTLELQKGHWVYDEYLSEFERMWLDATNA